MRTNCSSDREKLLKFEAEGREFAKFLRSLEQFITVEDGQKINKTFLGEYKVITPEQQVLGIILWFFMHLSWLWLSRLFAKML